MQQTLAAMAADLGVRTKALDAALAASTEADLAFQRAWAGETVDAVRSRVPQAITGAAAATPAEYGALLRRLQRLSQLLDAVEWRVLPALERYADADRRQTALMRGLLAEAGWTAWSPAVLTWSSSYFSASSMLRIVNVTAGEQDRILRIPDLCHEFGHCLYASNGADLTKGLLQDLHLWASVPDPEEAQLRDAVVGLWSETWLAEFTCDAVGTYLTGAAYAKQHLMLTARLHSDPYVHAPTHPADHARAALIAQVLRRIGRDTEADAFWIRWKALCDAFEQPVPDARLGAPAIKHDDFWLPYPSDDRGFFIDRVADLAVAGLDALGCERFAAAGIRGVVAAAWERYERDAAAYATAEPALMAELRGFL